MLLRRYNLIVLTSLSPLAIASVLLPNIHVQQPIQNELPSPSKISGTRTTLQYVAFGDSWASGVNWGPPSADTEFDFPDGDEVCRCRRMREAYPVQLLEDPDRTWTRGREVELQFVACHGAWFDAIADQVLRLRLDVIPDVATLMIGGNPAGFPEIIENCIYQFDTGKDYGPEYPDENGTCYKTLQDAHKTLEEPRFQNDLVKSIRTITNDARIWWNPRFRLYVLGYAGLFNHDDAKCNDWSFGFWPGKQPKLTAELRRAINMVVDHGRDVYDRVINHELFDPRVRYIDMNQVLANHRFCEPTEAGTFEAQNENSYLYSWKGLDCWPLSELRSNDTFDPMWPTLCRNCGGWGALGEVQRIFHPKREGHEAYKNALKAILYHELSY
jgi:hypothetical protein